jgi:squalene synthase HpnC
VLQSEVPKEAFAHCLTRARDHYENFPVASWLLPRSLRGPIAAIYCFARDADDLADEDPRPLEWRAHALREMQQRVLRMQDPAAENSPEWQALAWTCQHYQIPKSLLIDLCDAFLQDLNQTRYSDFGEVMAYCRRSANPVGRLLLHLTGNAGDLPLAHSDAVCSALQWINFFQDLQQDFHELGRIYLPQDEMARFGVTEAHIRDGTSDFRMRNLMQFQYRRVDRLLRAGAPLGKQLPGRLGLEIRAIIEGGARILWRLQQQQDVFSRPRLTRGDSARILWRSLRGAF